MDPETPGGSSSSRYIFINKVGSGTFGTVYKALDSNTNEIVALKQVKIFNKIEGLPMAFFREVKALQECLGQPNIVQYKGIFNHIDPSTNEESLFIVLEYCEFDLNFLISDPNRLLPLDLFKSLTLQIFNGVKVLHTKFGSKPIVHRDLKPSNILVDSHGIIKIADLGLARQIPPKGRCTKNVVTPGFRAPELLLSHNYNSAIDIWSLACIMFEMAAGVSLFNPSSDSEMDQLQAIFEMCGTPNSENAQELMPLPEIYSSGNPKPSHLYEYLDSHLRDDFKGLIPLLISMLSYNPSERPTIDDLIANDFFSFVETKSTVKQFIQSFNVPEHASNRIHVEKTKNTLLSRFRVSPPNISPPFVQIPLLA